MQVQTAMGEENDLDALIEEEENLRALILERDASNDLGEKKFPGSAPRNCCVECGTPSIDRSFYKTFKVFVCFECKVTLFLNFS